MYKEKLKKIENSIYQIQKEKKMLVPGRLFLSDKLLKLVEEDALKQIVNVAKLPGILKYSIGMSDMHVGYGFSIGGVAAFDMDKGVISPGGVGYDINCSVRLLKTNLTEKDIQDKAKQKKILNTLYDSTPSGVGVKGNLRLSQKELKEVLTGGAQWAVEKGYGNKEDYENTEEGGCMKNADPRDVSQKAIGRGMPQLGSLGAGNHFLEMQIVDEIFDKDLAKQWGLKKGQVTIMIHCGSRGLGHQVASDYIKLMEKEYGFPKFDRELVNAPIKSELGKKYFSAMSCAANFGFANKQLITHWVRKEIKKIFPKFNAEVLYDVCHNIAKFETHKVDGKDKEILVMRKGATRAFGPGRKELPKHYQKTGQPVIIPGTMGTSSYVLVGTEQGESLSWSSTAHGAGRVESRSKAIRTRDGETVKQELAKKGIQVRAGSLKGLSEEAPQAYKDIDEVVRVSHELGIAKLVARVRPVLVVKG